MSKQDFNEAEADVKKYKRFIELFKEKVDYNGLDEINKKKVDYLIDSAKLDFDDLTICTRKICDVLNINFENIIDEIYKKVNEKKENDKEKENNKEINIDELKTQILIKLVTGKRNEATEDIVNCIKGRERIYTIKNDQKLEMWIYEDGIYIPSAISKIKEISREILGEAHTTHLINNIIAKIEADTFIEARDFFINQDIFKLPVQNGILNLKTRELEPFNPDYFFFNKLPISYDSEADCPAIKKFFSDILSNEEDVKILQELAGFLLLRDYKFEKCFMFCGHGRNGKGKTLRLFQSFLGADNCSSVNIQTFSNNQFAAAELRNKLANLGGDIPAATLDDTSIIKMLSGRDMIGANRKFLTMVNFVNYAKLIFSQNEMPYSKDLSFGFFSRWIIINFPFTFLKQEEIDKLNDAERRLAKQIDENIIDSLTTPNELKGMLNWALNGFERLLEQRGFSYSYSTEETKTIWIRKSSSIQAFIMDCIEEAWSEHITKKEFAQEYAYYCKKHRLKLLSDKIVKDELAKIGIIELRLSDENRTHTWDGIKLKSDSDGQDGHGFHITTEFGNSATGMKKYVCESVESNNAEKINISSLKCIKCGFFPCDEFNTTGQRMCFSCQQEID